VKIGKKKLTENIETRKKINQTSLKIIKLTWFGPILVLEIKTG
jgi:hypothetical protein